MALFMWGQNNILTLHQKELKIPCFLSTISQTAIAHRFSLPGYLSGVEAVFSLKANTFPNRRKEVI